jgi:hypothetical protein
MSQQLRRVLVAFGLMAALLLATPSRSQAAGLRNVLKGYDLGATFRAWIEDLLPGATSTKPSSHRPAPGMEKEGSGINPNGVPQASTLPVPPTVTASSQGSMIDGKQ